MQTEDSYEQYKKHLESSLGVSALEKPKKPMNSYMRYFFERSCEERSKGLYDWKIITAQLTNEWKNLPENKRDYYEKISQIRVREYNTLHDEFERLSNKKKPLQPYARYAKKRYAQYSKEYKTYTPADITRLIRNDWKAISQKEKSKLQRQYEQQKSDLALNIDNTDQINEYKERLAEYHENLREEKQKIMKKYGVTAQTAKKLKQIQKQKERKRKDAERQLLKSQRRALILEQKKKDRELRKQKKDAEKEERRKIRQQQRLQQKEKLRKQKEKTKLEAEQKKKRKAEKKKKTKKKKNCHQNQKSFSQISQI